VRGAAESSSRALNLYCAAVIRSTDQSVTVSTHLLDLSAGGPAAGVAAELLDRTGRRVASGATDADGRLRFAGEFEPGAYTLRLELAPVSHLYRAVSLEVRLDEARHYHLPVLLSPFGLTTYRGS